MRQTPVEQEDIRVGHIKMPTDKRFASPEPTTTQVKQRDALSALPERPHDKHETAIAVTSLISFDPVVSI
jgi:hypothetical protein